ncbi:MAG: polysaccharide deacetylase family protein, partial [Clostridium sp.]
LIREKCLSRVKDQSIICLHDGGERSGGAKGAPEKVLQALPGVIRELKMAGYRFVLPGENK